MLGLALLFAGVLAFGLRRNQLTVGGLVGGFVAFLLNAFSLAALVGAAWAGLPCRRRCADGFGS